jgi:hypothetical protein
MSLASAPEIQPGRQTDWSGLMRALGPRFAERAPAHDATDTFVADNFAELRQQGVLAAAVPAELGGGGASYPQLCDMLRTLARYCGSTALTLSMHTHTVATLAWRWRRDPKPVEALLRRVAAERLLLIGSGASDWLTSSGRAERHDGGWRINAEKIFASGVPSGDLFLTQAIHDDPQDGPTVLHFAVPIKGDGVEVQETWRALGMRGTGSHHVRFKDVVVADSAIALRRPAGKMDSAVPPLCLHHSAAAHLRGLSRHRGGGARRRHRACPQASGGSRPVLPVRRDGERARNGQDGASRHGRGRRRLHRARSGDHEPRHDRPHAGRPRSGGGGREGDGSGRRQRVLSGRGDSKGCSATCRARGFIAPRSEPSFN